MTLRFDSPEVEAAWVADRIQALRGSPFTERDDTRGLTWSDCAILLRSVKNSGQSTGDALREAEIPYLIRGMNRLFETPEVQAARAVF